jgi:transcriptional regulator with XRE-family HTH domain
LITLLFRSKALTFGERIAARRKELGLKQVDVAKEAGISPQTLRSIEQGVTRPDRVHAENKHAIARALGVEVSWLEGHEPADEDRDLSHTHADLYRIFEDALPGLPRSDARRLAEHFFGMSPERRETFISEWRELGNKPEEKGAD